MSEQVQTQEPQRRLRIQTICMIVGPFLLAACIFIFVTGIGRDHGLGSYYHTEPNGGFESRIPGAFVLLGALAIPSVPIGVSLFLLGIANTIKSHSLRWLKITANILCGFLLGLALLYFLLVLFLLLAGF